MKLLQTLLSRHHPVPPAVLSPGITTADTATVAEEPPSGCGWFDSSHELRTGLQVRERAANDAVCAELPLAMWFELQQL